MRLRPYGDEAVLVEPDDPTAVPGPGRGPARRAGVLEVVPAARTVLVRAAARDLIRLGRRLDDSPPASTPRPSRRVRSCWTSATTAPTSPTPPASSASTPDGLVRAHTAGAYIVAFCGFAPGFAYLTGLDAALHVPRWPNPALGSRPARSGSPASSPASTRARRPAAGGCSGSTDAELWDVDRDPPALLAPGTRVRFRRAMIEILRPGPLATVQDLGRPGYAALGVPAFGRASTAPPCAWPTGWSATTTAPRSLEMTLGGLALRCVDAATVALTGAPCPGAPDWGAAVTLPAGTEVRLGAARGGPAQLPRRARRHRGRARARVAQHRHAQRPRPGAAARRRPAARRRRRAAR